MKKSFLWILWLLFLATKSVGAFAQCESPQNLTATPHSPLWYNVQLQWTAPAGTNPSVLIDSAFTSNDAYQGTRRISQMPTGATEYGATFDKASTVTISTVADDFILSEGTHITSMDFYGTLLNSSTATASMPFGGIYVRIYDGDPANGGQVIWGDMTTNIMGSASFTGIYRVASNARQLTTRPVFVVKASIDHTFPAGTYWVEVAASKAVNNANFLAAVPITKTTAVENTGNGKLCKNGTWSDWKDSGTGASYGLPYVVYGTPESTPHVTSYNILRNGTSVAHPLSTATSYLDLVPETGSYQYEVKAIWSNNCESSATVSLDMLIDPCATAISSFPYLQGFEGTTIPSCWQQEQVNKTTSWQFVAGTTGTPNTAHSGSYKAYFAYSSTGGGNDATTKLITPMLDISNLQNPAVDFWHTQKMGPGNQDRLRLYYKNTPEGEWILIKEFDTDFAVWTQEIIALPNPTATYWVAFEGVVKSGYGIMLDDIMIQYADRCPAVTNLVGAQESGVQDIKVTWEAPAKGENINSYTIYRDGNSIATGITTTSYIDQGLAVGSYTYSVKVVYNNQCGESELVTTLPVVVRDVCGDKPENLTATKNTPGWYNVTLDWKEPTSVGGNWDDHGGDYYTSVGNAGSWDFVIATRWYPGDLAPLEGKKLSSVKFVPGEPSTTCTYSVRVWVGVSSSSAGTLVVDQVVPASSIKVDEWNDVVLETPVTVDPSGEMWVGIRCNTINGWPAGVDNGPTIGTDYNMVFSNGIWKTLAAVLPTSANRNFCIGGYFTDASSPDLRGYNIYRNGGKINEPYSLYSKNSFIDLVPSAGTYTYGVSAVWSSTCTSPTIEQTVVIEQNPCEIPASLPLIEGFEFVGIPECWQVFSENSSNWERVAQGVYPMCDPHSGTGMLKFNSHLYNSGATGLIVSKLLPTKYEKCKLSFWMYRDNENSATERVEVYLSSNSDISDLAAIKTVHRYASLSPATSIIGWNKYEVEFSPKDMPAAYIIFKAVGNHGNCIYIDDITIESMDVLCNPPTNLTSTVEETKVALTWNVPEEVIPTNYNVYRNDVLQTTTTATSYTQNTVPNGTYTYCVKAVYTTCESENVCKDVIVNYSPITYTITASAGANGGISPNGEVPIVSGGSVTFTITPQTGYKVKEVLVDNVNIPTAVSTRSYTFTNVIANHTIAASFEATTYSITATAGVGGSISPSGNVAVSYGSSQSFTITANTGYKIAQVLVNGQNNTAAVASGSYTFTNVVSNQTISAIFEAITYTITATAGANGSITPSGTTTINYGSSQAYTITADAGYKIKSVLIDGTAETAAVGASSYSYTFNNVTANHTISAEFEQSIFTITATADANGTIAPDGATTLTYGDSQEYTITANEGYKIKSVSVDDVAETAAVGASSYSYTFSNVTADHTISAEFEQITYTITATAGTNGSISPAGTTTVSYGSNQAYTITANNDYLIKDVKVDGVAESAAVGKTTYNYTFSNVKANHTISATFEIANPELTGITVNNQPQTISSAMDYMAACGEQSVSMTLTAVGEVKVNGAAYTNGSPISLTGDKTVITITVTAGSNTATYTLTVAKALGSATPLYIERWGATIAIVNNPANNGGYTFDQIRWYRDGSSAVVSTDAYVVGNISTHYADVHAVETGAWHHTCRTKATPAPVQIVVYPNPVLSAQTLNVNLPEGLNEVNIDVYDINGKLVKQHPRVTTTLTAPTGTGIYVLKIQLPDGSITTEKIVVK